MDFGKFLGRVGALVLGLIGVVLGLVVNFVYSGANDLLKVTGNNAGTQTHGVIGLVLILVAFVGALIALFKPGPAALFLLIGGAGFFYPVHLYALIASPFLLLAALLAFIDRDKPATQKA